MSSLRCLSLVASLAIPSVACSGGGHPVIDDFQANTSATLAPDGNYHVTGHYFAHEDGHGAVDWIRIRVPSLSLETRHGYGSGVGAGDAPLFDLPGATPKGPIQYNVSVIDSNGEESAALVSTVILE
jgi:hypothetical protein